MSRWRSRWKRHSAETCARRSSEMLENWFGDGNVFIVGPTGRSNGVDAAGTICTVRSGSFGCRRVCCGCRTKIYNGDQSLSHTRAPHDAGTNFSSVNSLAGDKWLVMPGQDARQRSIASAGCTRGSVYCWHDPYSPRSCHVSLWNPTLPLPTDETLECLCADLAESLGGHLGWCVCCPLSVPSLCRVLRGSLDSLLVCVAAGATRLSRTALVRCTPRHRPHAGLPASIVSPLSSVKISVRLVLLSLWPLPRATRRSK